MLKTLPDADHAPATGAPVGAPSLSPSALTRALPPRWHACAPDPHCPHCNGTAGAEEALDWSFIDGAYCISLNTREDRVALATAQFHKVGLCRRVLFFRPDRHPTKGIIGSWESHRAVAIRALEQGQERALVFEDDVVFDRPVRPESLRAIARAMDRLPSDWMIFFLGHWPVRAYFVRRNVLRTWSGCAHAYIASRRLQQWLRDHPWTKHGVAKNPLVGRALDAAFARLPAAYALFPMIATQSASPSDNITAQQKRNRKNKWRLRHLVTHSRHREWLLSRLMRPTEYAVALLSPAFYATELVGRARRRLIGRDLEPSD
jgi:glycosyl transferase family 25